MTEALLLTCCTAAHNILHYILQKKWEEHTQ